MKIIKGNNTITNMGNVGSCVAQAILPVQMQLIKIIASKMLITPISRLAFSNLYFFIIFILSLKLFNIPLLYHFFSIWSNYFLID